MNKPVMTTAGRGRLWQARSDTCGVVLDDKPDVVTFLHPAERELPGARTKEGSSLINASLAHPAHKRVAEETRRELWRTILRESEARYRHEFMDADEREEVWSRIVCLRRRLGIKNA